MALGTYNMDITFTEGQDTRTDSKNVTISKPLELKNVRFDRTGAITTRPGFQTLTTQSADAAVNIDNTSIIFNDGVIYHQTGSTTSAIGVGYNAYVRKQSLGAVCRSGTQLNQRVDAAVFGTTLLTAWSHQDAELDLKSTPQNHIRARIDSIQDRFGNSQMQASIVLGTDTDVTSLQVSVPSAQYGVVWYRPIFTSTLIAYVINLTTYAATPVTFSTPITITGTFPVFRIAPISKSGGTATFGIVYSVGGPSIALRHVSLNLATASATVSAAQTVASIEAKNLAICTSTVSGTSRLNCIWSTSGTAITARSYTADSSLTGVWGPTDISTTYTANWVGIVQKTSVSHELCIMAQRHNVPTPTLEHEVGTLSATGTYTQNAAYLYSVALLGRLYYQDNRPLVGYVTFNVPSSQVGEIGALVWDSTFGATKIASWESSGLVTASGSLTPYGTNKWVFAGDGPIELTNVYANQITTAGTVALVSAAEYRYAPYWTYIDLTGQRAVGARVNAHTLIGAGTWLTYDGARCKPSYFPNTMTHMTDATTGSSGFWNGVYQYCATMEWIDARGNKHISAPSLAVLYYATSASFKDIDFQNELLYTFNPGWVRREATDEPRLVWYTTEANGTIFYNNAIGDITYGGRVFDYTRWSLLESSGFPADINDPSIQYAPLYTTGGVLENDSLPSPRYVAEFKERLVALTAGYDNRIYYSKPAVPGLAVEWSVGLYIDVPARGGLTLAAQQMDSALYIFKRNQILTTYGDPAGATGDGGSLSSPQVIFDGVGIEDPESIVLTPKGIMFKSNKGFYIILRNQELAYVGEGVFAYDAQVVGSACDLERHEALFMLADGKVLVYNYYQNGWSYLDTGLALSYVFGLYKAELVTIASSNGVLTLPINSNSFTYTDGPINSSLVNIASKVATGWVRLNGIAGFQRIKRAYLVGDWSSTANIGKTLEVKIYTDFQNTPVQTVTINLDTLNPNDAFEIHLQVQKCQALQFVCEQNGGRFDLSGITLDLGVKTGTNKSRNGAGSY